MQVDYKRLDTGYHYAQAVGYAHLYAQWPVGSLIVMDDISYGESMPSDQTFMEFLQSAERASLGKNGGQS